MRGIFPAALALLLASAAADAAPKTTPPVPKGNPGLWVTTEDYPPSALREEAEGVVRFTLTVDATGVPTACEITQSSGRPDLDDATCRLIAERARFEPAKDPRGRPFAGAYANTVRWQIPQGRPAPAPGTLISTIVVEKDGTVSSCTVDVAEGSYELARERACAQASAFEPIIDAEGNPVRKRVRATLKVEYEDLP
jgi:TonB family protein